jgi:membrane-bound lytic murein transglycosylase F
MLSSCIQSSKSICLLMLSGVLFGCQHNEGHAGQLQTILRTKQLVVATRNAPTTYYEWHDEIVGPEYDLTQAFAKYLGVKVRYVVKDTVSDVLAAVDNGEADIAAAGLTRTPDRKQRFLFGPIYQEVQQQVVCRVGGKRPRTVADLTDLNLSVPLDTSYAELLQSLQLSNPGLQWRSADDDTESLLEEVWQRQLDCTIADSNIVAINRRYYPELRVRFNLTKPQPVSWIMSKQASDLQQAVSKWLDQYQRHGGLENVLERYYGYINEFDYVDTSKFRQRILHVLPNYRDIFEQAASKYDLDWTLLAAQAYQESHWKAKAISPTGVRGIMMLTLDTAKELGLSSRLDPKQSIFGGARYYRDLYDRIPDKITDPDRNWLTLAAYNIGMGHLNDARILAQRLGKNPNRWSDLSSVFPLLSRKKYYKTLQHGYARGSESVSYVQHIRDYHNILYQTIASLSHSDSQKQSQNVASAAETR